MRRRAVLDARIDRQGVAPLKKVRRGPCAEEQGVNGER